MTVLLTGGCNCGAVRFEITEPLFGARYCHCTRCQRRTGRAASASAAEYRQFVAYAASWEAIPDDALPRYPERKPPG